MDSAEFASRTYLSVDEARLLVCDNCWNSLFGRARFRGIFESAAGVWDPTMRRSFEYPSAWDAIEASSRRGCNWCSLLMSTWEGDPWFPKQEGVLTIGVAFEPPLYDRVGGTLLGAQLVRAQVNDNDLFSYPLYALADDTSADEIVARERIYQMRSTETCRLALDHLSFCIENHDRCPKPPQDRVLPTRVIDCTDPRRPCLYITDGSVPGSYVALSYVWGEDQPNKTKQHNVDTYARGINVDLLPQTLRDAIWVAHACGEKYLWIDALCIIQDSKEDKRREIAKIPATFADASFTIIAARSSKASDGFLQDCPPPSVPIRHLPFPCANDPSRFGTMYVEQDSLDRYDDNCDMSDPVHQRAWCFEELLLSTRALQYTSNTLRFHCRTVHINIGDAVRGVRDRPTRHIVVDWMPADEPELDTEPDAGSDYDRSMKLWDDIVRSYTKRTVTHIEDKLIALAGVAVRFGARWKKGAYLAGLWLDNLPHNLLWHKARDVRRPRPAVYRAPSWSWASVDGPVDAARPTLGQVEVLCELKGHGLTLASNKIPFGAVTAGFLTLGARLLKAAWHDDDLYAFPPAVGGSSLFAEDDARSRIFHACRDAIEPYSADVWLLPVCSQGDWTWLQGLIVVRAGNAAEYRRVGCFQDHRPKWISRDDLEDLCLHSITLV